MNLLFSSPGCPLIICFSLVACATAQAPRDADFCLAVQVSSSQRSMALTAHVDAFASASNPILVHSASMIQSHVLKDKRVQTHAETEEIHQPAVLDVDRDADSISSSHFHDAVSPGDKHGAMMQIGMKTLGANTSFNKTMVADHDRELKVPSLGPRSWNMSLFSGIGMRKLAKFSKIALNDIKLLQAAVHAHSNSEIIVPLCAIICVFLGIIVCASMVLYDYAAAPEHNPLFAPHSVKQRDHQEPVPQSRPVLSSSSVPCAARPSFTYPQREDAEVRPLCLELIVPEGKDCTLLVPGSSSAQWGGGQAGHFQITDENGKPLLGFGVSSTTGQHPLAPPRLTFTPSASGESLAYCSAGQGSASGPYHVHRADGVLFATLSTSIDDDISQRRQKKTDQIFVLSERSGHVHSIKMPLLGSSCGQILITCGTHDSQARCGEVEPDKSGGLKVRLGPGADIGAVLCGLFCSLQLLRLRQVDTQQRSTP